jgi:hypothetical protein
LACRAKALSEEQMLCSVRGSGHGVDRAAVQGGLPRALDVLLKMRGAWQGVYLLYVPRAGRMAQLHLSRRSPSSGLLLVLGSLPS